MSTKKKPAKKSVKKTPKATSEATAATPAPEATSVNEQVEPSAEPEVVAPVVPQPEQTDTTPESPETAEPSPEPPTDASQPPESPSSSQEATMPTVGDVLERTYKGKLIRVEVVESGFRWEGTVYSSPSAVARAATGTKSAINGRAWLGIGRGEKRSRRNSLQTKIKRIDSQIERLRDAVKDAEAAIEKGKLELAEAEAKRGELAQQAGTESP